MKKHFLAMLVLCAFMMKLQSGNMFANYIDNETQNVKLNGIGER